MKIKMQKHFHAEVATASLNDIMFFLLLFFLIISTVTNPNVIKILLPKSQANQTLNKQPITLTVTKDKAYYINKRPVPFAKLEESIKNELAGIPEPTVVLRLEESLTVQDLTAVLEIGAKNKIKMVLATRQAN
ncbi:MAG TPA: biopolymer transporter ExbD [Ohtaekwangia sp.]